MPVFKALRFVVGFGVARAALFFAPIALANLLPLDRYGQFELAQSYAAICALVLGAGLPATVPLIRLRDEIEGRWDTLLLLIIGLSGSCILLALMAALGLGTLYSLPALMLLAVGVLILQGLWATLLKTEGRTTSAVFVEAGFWTMAVLGAGMMVLSRDRLSETAISIVLLVYAAVLMMLTLTKYCRSRGLAVRLSDLKRNLALGLPLMLTSVLTVVISSSGRMVLGETSGVEAVGLYAVLYRSTTLPLVGHQILIIGLFRQIFSWSPEVLRARATVIVFGVSGMVVAFWIFEPYLGWLLGPRFAEIFASHRVEGFILLVQTILWSAIALNDLINSRLQIAGRVTAATGPYLFLGLGALIMWIWSRTPTLEIDALLREFIWGHLGLMVGFYAMQCAASWLLGHHFFRLWLTVLACTIGTGLLILLGERFS